MELSIFRLSAEILDNYSHFNQFFGRYIQNLGGQEY
ncbi:MAG: hypothetical protein UY78_C0041G0007 [Parcubacteria group bacterium GW2011_GWA1_53_13]|nr:MAG: hypothetical protein UY78_C0041G0007 [Parcubacteria group bacterium GW2011_GWA1_53_13]